MKSNSTQNFNSLIIQKEKNVTISENFNEIYGKYLPGLKAKDTNTQLKTIREFYSSLLNDLKKLKREEETLFIDSLITLIKKLGSDKSEISDKQACILIIASIINLDNINVRASTVHQQTLFIHLRNLLKCKETNVTQMNIIQMASRAMGRLVIAGVECDVEFKNGLENLRSDDETKRYCGIISVRELALASPSRLFLNSNMFFQDIMIAITDKNSTIRQEACELFRLSLHIIISREASHLIRTTDGNIRDNSTLSLRRSSTASSLTNSQDSLTTSVNASMISTSNHHHHATSNDYYFTLQYKCCFENAIKELETWLNAGLNTINGQKKDQQGSSSNKKDNRIHEDKIHGYLLILIEVLKFSSLEFEKEIDKNISLYIATDMSSQQDCENNNQLKSCDELHSKNLLTLLPYCFEPANDPFLFLFKSEKISVKIDSRNCRNLINEKYDVLCSLIKRLVLFNNIHIQQALLLLIPRLANFDKQKFSKKYLNDAINSINLILSKKMNLIKLEALFSAGLLSIAVGEPFLDHADRFFEIIRTSSIFNVQTSKDGQKKKGIVNPLSNSSSSSITSVIGVSSSIIANSVNAPITSALSKYGFYSITSSTASSLTNIQNTIMGSINATDELNSILACVSMFAKSMPTEKADDILELLEPLMVTSGGVTKTMRHCLEEISKWIPQLRPAIHENLLKIISQILTGKPLCQIIQTVSSSATQLSTQISSSSITPTPLLVSSISSTSLSSESELAQSVSEKVKISFSTQNLPPSSEENLIIQALQTLRTFEFTTVYIIAFLRYCVDLYINHESSNIKIETILTTSALLNRLIKVIEQQESRSLISMVSSSLRKLLDSALSDTDPNVRYYILNSLNFPQFNMYLALPENLNILFLCVRDERLEIRELSASIISKLSVSNSAYILPFVRKILMQLLIEIEIYPDLSSKETTVRLIGHLLSYTPRLVNLYAKPLLSNLHRKLTDYRYDIRFASSIITIVGQLASQSGPETLYQFDSMFPFIIESMQDFYYIQLKHTSLWTIGQIIVNTGYVIEPYRKYPSLLKILLDFLQNETNIPVRRETIRILGLIGAIDPFEYKRNAQLKISNDPNVIEHTCDTKYPVANQTKTTIFEPSEILSSVNTLTALEEYYPMLAINLLIKIIKNAIGITPRKDAIQALVYAMRNLDTRCANYVEYVIPPFLELIKNMNDNIVIDLITQLGHLVIYIKKHIDPYINGILDVVKFYWNMTEKQTIIIALIDLIQSIVNVMGIEYKKYLPETIPLILKKLQREILGNKTPNVQKLLHLTRSCSASMEFYVHLMLGQLIEFLNNPDVDRVVKQDIMFTIYTFSKNINLVDNVAILFQCFVKLFDQYQSYSTPPIFTSYLTNQRQTSFPSLTNIKINNQTDLLLIVLETQYIVAKQMGSKFSMYMPMFDKIILKKGNYLKFYEQLVTNWKHAININHSLLGFLTIMQSNNDDHVSRQQASQNRLNEPSVTSNPVVAQINTTSIQISNLRVRYDKAEQLTSRDAWRESFRRFQVAIVEETPQPTLKTCSLIAHDSVPMDLFNACFISIWTNLTETEQNELTRYLELALKNSDVQDIIKIILNLAEFMERCEIQIPIDLRILADKASSVRAYAKSLHYVEEQFHSYLNNNIPPTSDVLEHLVTLNHELQRTEAATGVLDYGTKHLKNLDMRIKERWNEKLHDWQKALSAYEKELSLEQPAALSAASANLTSFQTDPKTLNLGKLELILGKMRCLKGLGDWSKLNYVCKDMINCISQLTVVRDDHADESRGPDERASIFPISTIQTSPQVAPPMRRRYHLSSSNTDQQLILTQQQQQNFKSYIAEMGAAASWGLSDWDSMDTYVKLIPEKSYEGSLYRAVLSINNNQFDKTVNYLQDTRDMLDTDLTSMAFQSYERAYQAIIETQVLSELEEIITYKTIPSKRESLEKTWWKRLQGCEKSLEYWHRLLLVRSIVLPKEKNVKPWLKFSSLCQKAGHLNLSFQILNSLLKEYSGLHAVKEINLDSNNDFEHCKYSYLKYLACNFKKEAYTQLGDFVSKSLHPQYNKLIQVSNNNGGGYTEKRVELERLLSKCYLKLGRWLYDIDEGMKDSNISHIISYYHVAKENHKDWYKAWNAWAYANYEAIQYYKNNSLSSTTSRQTSSRTNSGSSSLFGSLGFTNQQEANLNQYLKPAMQGFIKCIKLSPKTTLHETNCLQDTLRLLTLWFEYCNSPDLYEILSDGINSTPLEIWLQVIPQLIARIDSPKQHVTKLIHKLLVDLGRLHPQALVYRLILASKSSNTTATTTSALIAATMNPQTARSIAALKILQSLREHSSTLVEQAKLVSEELIRVAILWHEQWHEGLEDASKQYYNEQNIKGMLETVDVLHNMMERGATTGNETAFLANYGVDLNDAKDFCSRYKHTRNLRELELAWDKYYHVFRKITKQLPTMTSLELNYVSPKLILENELELAVPGTYEPHKPLVKIKSLSLNIQVITSKQRPRKISIQGSDGREYAFLLKGHEDLRQDERVMQIFGLVNSLLLKNHETARRDLAIQRYSVIPLSQNSGLLEWLMNCDTLHALIREYREKKKIQLNFEHRIITRVAPDYEHLTPIQKIEIFEMALDNSQGDDLAKILWFKSLTAEKWLERRTNYIRSLAVMSMVGYVLGLGDRHPSNLMLDRTNGKIIHVDFGDCFEAAMIRDKFPEKIPFRLTRMLKSAMEVTGIEGTYRRTCESVMKVLRNNRESVMAVLEAFIYDPLFSWRLIEANNLQQSMDNVTLSSLNNPSTAASNTNNASFNLLSGESQYLNTSQIDESGEEVNRKALKIIKRINDKLTGHDFGHDRVIDEKTQVDLLIRQATSSENLCQCFIGWCAWW